MTRYAPGFTGPMSQAGPQPSHPQPGGFGQRPMGQPQQQQQSVFLNKPSTFGNPLQSISQQPQQGIGQPQQPFGTGFNPYQGGFNPPQQGMGAQLAPGQQDLYQQYMQQQGGPMQPGVNTYPAPQQGMFGEAITPEKLGIMGYPTPQQGMGGQPPQRSGPSIQQLMAGYNPSAGAGPGQSAILRGPSSLPPGFGGQPMVQPPAPTLSPQQATKQRIQAKLDASSKLREQQKQQRMEQRQQRQGLTPQQAPTTQQIGQEDPRMQAMRNMQQMNLRG